MLKNVEKYHNLGQQSDKINGCLITRRELYDIQEHILTARNFISSLLSAPTTDQVLSYCSHGATFHWPVVSRYANGSIASYISFPRTLKEMFLPDLAFSQPAVTFSEDYVTLTLLMHGTHTCNRAVGTVTVETAEMQVREPYVP